MQTSSPTDVSKSEPLGTYEATFPNLNGTAPWRLLDALLMDVKSFMSGQREMPVTMRLQPTPSSIVLSLSVGQPLAPTSPASTPAAAPGAPSPDESVPRYSWDEVLRAAAITANETAGAYQPPCFLWLSELHENLKAKPVNRFYPPGDLPLRDLLSPSASSGASQDSSSS